MNQQILTLLVAMSVSISSWASTVQIVYTAGFADMMDRKGHYVLSQATFDAESGALRGVENLTTVDTFAMGYVAASPDRVYFSAQHHLKAGGLDDVEIYTESRRGGAPTSTLTPAVTDTAGLLEPCRAQGCTDASTYYPQPSSHGDLLFAYRAWNGFGVGVGNQAIAVQDAAGRSRPLTFNLTENPSTLHTCPRWAPGSNGTRVLFVTAPNGADKAFLALHDLSTGTTQVMRSLPSVTVFSGCPDFLTPTAAQMATGEASFFYVADTGSATDPQPMMAGGLLAPDGGIRGVKPWWPVPLVTTPSAVDVLRYRFCQHIAPASTGGTSAAEPGGWVTCLTPDDRVAKLAVEDGRNPVNYTPPLLPFQKGQGVHRFCLTANCYTATSGA